MTPEAGLARPADGEGPSDKAPIDPDIDLHARSPQGETATRLEAIVDNTAELRCGPMIEKLPDNLMNAIDVVPLHHVEDDGERVVLHVRVRRVHPVVRAVGLREVRVGFRDVVGGAADLADG